MTQMTDRQAKQFIKWGVIFPKGVFIPKKSTQRGYIFCPECGEFFSKNKVRNYVTHFQKKHKVKKVKK